MKYKTFDELVSESGINLTDENTIIHLRKIADRILNHAVIHHTESDLYGYSRDTASVRQVFSDDKKILRPFQQPVVWADYVEQCIYCVNYVPSEYINRPDILIIMKEYLTPQKQSRVVPFHK